MYLKKYGNRKRIFKKNLKGPKSSAGAFAIIKTEGEYHQNP